MPTVSHTWSKTSRWVLRRWTQIEQVFWEKVTVLVKEWQIRGNDSKVRCPEAEAQDGSWNHGSIRLDFIFKVGGPEKFCLLEKSSYCLECYETRSREKHVSEVQVRNNEDKTLKILNMWKS